MGVAPATAPPPPVAVAPARPTAGRIVPFIPGLIVVGLMLVWAEHDGGYDADTWYWGALLLLTLLAATLIGLGARGGARSLSRGSILAVSGLGAYTAWSYLSISWAQVPGWALEGSNRTLLYLAVFALFLVIPWTARAALWTLVAFALGVGVLALVILLRFAGNDHIGQLLLGNRLIAPTGYYNSSVALFMMDALVAVALSVRRELPGPVRGALLALAAASLQLCVTGQSRGWLFTLPLVVLVAILVVRDRLRVAAAVVAPVLAALIPVHRLLHVYASSTGAGLTHAVQQAGRISLALCAAVFVVGTLAAWGDGLARLRPLSRSTRRWIGGAVGALALLVACAGGLAATHGHPVAFVKRQWNGFSNPVASTDVGSHFASVGTGRYDIWRVSLDAFTSHPIGGLGQDNFADYYITRRRTGEEPRWTHSIELRLLAQSGIAGTLLFAVFLLAAVAVAFRAIRRAGPLGGAVAAAALLPLVVWIIHGSVDWFWEVPALSAPALGFLAMAMSLADRTAPAAVREGAAPRAPEEAPPPPPPSRRPLPARGRLAWGLGAVAFLAGIAVLAFPYLSVREVSVASDVAQRNPQAALRDLATAHDLNPLNPDPGRLAGTIALQTSNPLEAQRRFQQTISTEPGGWFAWLGAGLAASALGEVPQARHDYGVAESINSREPTIAQALALVGGRHPLTPAQALKMLSSEQ